MPLNRIVHMDSQSKGSLGIGAPNPLGHCSMKVPGLVGLRAAATHDADEACSSLLLVICHNVFKCKWFFT
jgi:hypothetical protein